MSTEAQGCTYTRNNGVPCAKVCDPGQILCPHHILISQAEANIRKTKGKPPASEKGNARRTPRGYEQ
jgi:hypothetical protein